MSRTETHDECVDQVESPEAGFPPEFGHLRDFVLKYNKLISSCIASSPTEPGLPEVPEEFDLAQIEEAFKSPELGGNFHTARRKETQVEWTRDGWEKWSRRGSTAVATYIERTHNRTKDSSEPTDQYGVIYTPGEKGAPWKILMNSFQVNPDGSVACYLAILEVFPSGLYEFTVGYTPRMGDRENPRYEPEAFISSFSYSSWNGAGFERTSKNLRSPFSRKPAEVITQSRRSGGAERRRVETIQGI